MKPPTATRRYASLQQAIEVLRIMGYRRVQDGHGYLIPDTWWSSMWTPAVVKAIPHGATFPVPTTVIAHPDIVIADVKDAA